MIETPNTNPASANGPAKPLGLPARRRAAAVERVWADWEVVCVRCGYALMDLPAEGDCPECGLSVAATLTPEWVRADDDKVLNQLTLGGWLEALGCLFCVFAPVWLVAVWLGLVQMFPLFWLGQENRVLAVAAWLVPWPMWLGHWCITATSSTVRHAPVWRTRRRVRWLLVAAALVWTGAMIAVLWQPSAGFAMLGWMWALLAVECALLSAVHCGLDAWVLALQRQITQQWERNFLLASLQSIMGLFLILTAVAAGFLATSVPWAVNVGPVLGGGALGGAGVLPGLDSLVGLLGAVVLLCLPVVVWFWGLLTTAAWIGWDGDLKRFKRGQADD